MGKPVVGRRHSAEGRVPWELGTAPGEQRRKVALAAAAHLLHEFFKLESKASASW